MSNQHVITELTSRGFVSQLSSPEIEKKLTKSSVTLYAGFDPTAKSLHIGNLLQIMLLAQYQRYGHKPLALVGGATAMIGDPSGKSQERVLLTEEVIEANLVGIKNQLSHFLDFDCGQNSAELVNNFDWIGKFSFIEFLRDVGKNFRVGEMMGKESVRKRLNSEAGMSYTEFSYQLLQGYDFLHLYREKNCILQVGGDDQWGNITAGIELTRKVAGEGVFGMTSPLLTTASGQKFGKTEAGTIWLDAEMTRPYDFYQYWMRVDDRDVVNLLKRFTFMPMEEISEIAKLVEIEPEKRAAQKVLAEYVTELVHGKQQLELVQKATSVLFGSEISGLNDAELTDIFADVPSSTMSKGKLDDGINVLDLFVESGLLTSKGEAKKLIKNGGAYLNNNKVTDMGLVVNADNLASETVMVLRSGKKKYNLVRFI